MPLNKAGAGPLRFGPALAFVAGAGNVLAFAPYGLWPLQILSLCVLCWLLLRSERVRHSALLGWMYGFGFCDIDGHRWNVLYMDMSKMPK